MNKRILIITILSVFAAVQFSGCSLLRKRVEKKEKTEYKLTSINKNSISLNNVSGEIKVTGTNDTTGTITVIAEKTAEVKRDEMDKPIESVQVKLDTTGKDIKIETEYRKTHFSLFSKHDDGSVNYEIKVPAGIAVDIDNTNGTISFSEISNDIKVNSVNGNINLVRCRGNIKIDGVNGGVFANLDSLKGLTVDIVNGNIKVGSLKDANARVSANTTNGRVKLNNLTFSDFVSGKKSLSGTLGTGTGVVKLETVNGSITLDANDIALSKKKSFDNFNFQFDFDDEDNVKVEKNQKKDGAKTLDSNTQDSKTRDSKTQDTNSSRAK